jgi:hypothetical protein
MKKLPFKAWLVRFQSGSGAVFENEKDAKLRNEYELTWDKKSTITPVLITEVKKKK